jgi:hypothetical protein
MSVRIGVARPQIWSETGLGVADLRRWMSRCSNGSASKQRASRTGRNQPFRTEINSVNDDSYPASCILYPVSSFPLSAVCFLLTAATAPCALCMGCCSLEPPPQHLLQHGIASAPATVFIWKRRYSLLRGTPLLKTTMLPVAARPWMLEMS